MDLCVAMPRTFRHAHFVMHISSCTFRHAQEIDSDAQAQ